MDVLAWLLDSDPAMRDLGDESEAAFELERSRVASEGLGADLLARQQPTGGWGVDPPTRYHETAEGSATHALMLLLEFGLHPASDEAQRAVGLARDHLRHTDSDPRYVDGGTEACINGRVVAIGVYFGETIDGVVERLLEEQVDDGGWNCEAPPSTRSSFHSTICAPEGLLQHKLTRGPTAAVSEARRRGQEYLLERGMFRSRTSGQVIDAEWIRFAHPCGYHSDVLRGLDDLRKAGAPPDERLAEALELVRRHRSNDGRWPLDVLHVDQYPPDLGEEPGRPSRWITLRALRALRWHEDGPAWPEAAASRIRSSPTPPHPSAPGNS
jgi:hypothetical protein